jgi:hypothetical protein
MQILEPSPKTARGLSPRLSGTRGTSSHANVEDPRWQLARRIAASRTLGRSRLLADFLLYTVDRHIRDRADEITEQQIGVLVFGRPEGYDANDDNIVRSYARNLRKRIDEYFATEGKDETLLLEIPRGGYAPAFSPRRVEVNTPTDSLVTPDATSSLAGNDTDDSSPKITQIPDTETDSTWSPIPTEAPTSVAVDRVPVEAGLVSRKYGAILVLCIGIALGLGCSLLQPLRLLKHLSASPAEAASNRLWTQLFSRDRNTFIVPSDDGLIIMQRLTERPVPLADYISGSYRTSMKTDNVPGAPEILKLGKRRYTSVVDLDFVARLAQLDEVVPGRMMIRYARDLRMDDLRADNTILIGSDEANPWIELFQPRMNFRFSINPGSDKPSGISNTHPRVGENAIYGTPGPDHTYGLIAYVPNLTSTGHVLIVGGLNTAGTEAAATFLLTPSLMMPTLQRARAAHGGLQQFELLIGAGDVATNASAPQLILERIGPP